MTEIPAWHISGDCFDNCSCAVACPCTFAQAPITASASRCYFGISGRAITATSASRI